MKRHVRQHYKKKQRDGKSKRKIHTKEITVEKEW